MTERVPSGDAAIKQDFVNRLMSPTARSAFGGVGVFLIGGLVMVGFFVFTGERAPDDEVLLTLTPCAGQKLLALPADRPVTASDLSTARKSCNRERQALPAAQQAQWQRELIFRGLGLPKP